MPRQRLSATIQAVLQRLGKPERFFIALLLIYAVLASLIASNGFLTFLRVVLILLGIWVLVRLSRTGMRKAIWRLRNRLMMTYVFIAVVPILLILIFAGFGAYALSSQLAVYLVSAELDRRVAELNWVAHGISDASPRDRQRVLTERAELLTHGFDNPAITLKQGDSVTVWPNADGNHDSPPTRSNISGILVRDGRFYVWAHAMKDDADVTVVAPLSRTYLSNLVPGLGDVALFVFSKDARASRTVEPPEPSASKLAPAQNILDVSLRGGSFMPFVYWGADENARAQPDHVLISVETRPSALLGTIFSAKVADIQQIIPVALFGVAILFLLVEVSSLVAGVSLARSITGAVHQLYTGTQRVMQSDFSNRIRVSKSRDQLAALSTSFNTMTENLERLLDVAKEKERLQAELEIAREVQEQLYPKEIPSMKTVRLTAFWQSARVVSGDYFDYQRLGEDQLALAIGDVAGKGISAALLMATIQSAMRMQLHGSLQAAAPAGTVVRHLSPANVVADLNQQLHQNTATEKFATFCFGLYDETTGVFRYTNAGHLPPILIHNGAATRLDVNGMVVGAFPFATYDESQVRLQPGDLLVFFTDGITEPENEYGEMFGEERLTEIFVKNANRPEEETIAAAMEAVRQWSTSPERQDDMTLLVARRL